MNLYEEIIKAGLDGDAKSLIFLCKQLKDYRMTWTTKHLHPTTEDEIWVLFEEDVYEDLHGFEVTEARFIKATDAHGDEVNLFTEEIETLEEL